MIADRFCVGLTGGIACGKSATATFFEEFGGRVLDADAVVHRLYEPGEPGAQAASGLLGPRILDDKGGVDRQRLAELVYRDETSRRELEKRVHPLVREELRRWLAKLPAPILPFFSAALLVETGACERFPVIVCVTCNKSLQETRLQARDPDLSEEEAARRIAAQMTLEEKRRRCSGIRLLQNDSGFDELRLSCGRLYKELLREKQIAENG